MVFCALSVTCVERGLGLGALVGGWVVDGWLFAFGFLVWRDLIVAVGAVLLVVEVFLFLLLLFLFFLLLFLNKFLNRPKDQIHHHRTISNKRSQKQEHQILFIIILNLVIKLIHRGHQHIHAQSHPGHETQWCDNRLHKGSQFLMGEEWVVDVFQNQEDEK